ncbi:signal peptidase I [Dietzia maris]|uniref:Signal peptidase I n=1 Tax=Dietzia maris TaxID=37915 RepID=A0A365PD67_9ACTN|nr:signal peptidase I [Dietzia maris]
MTQNRDDKGRGFVNSGNRELALNIGAIAGLICIVAASLSMFLGFKPLVFQSGSMSPSIQTGALAFARTVPADQLEVGDVVSVTNASGVRITHRVAGLEPVGGGEMMMTMRGDANGADDPVPYYVSEADRVVCHINGLGYAVAWLSNPVAIFLGGIVAGGLLVIAFGRTRTTTTDESASGEGAKTDGADPRTMREMEEARHG